ADVGNQHLRLIFEPLLVPEEQEENDHRRANQVIVEVVFEEAELDQYVAEPVHGRCPPCGPTTTRREPRSQPAAAHSTRAGQVPPPSSDVPERRREVSDMAARPALRLAP